MSKDEKDDMVDTIQLIMRECSGYGDEDILFMVELSARLKVPLQPFVQYGLLRNILAIR